jgi:Protein of unknown function (DUF2867)
MRPVPKLFVDPDRVLPGAQFTDSYALTVHGLSLDAVSATQRVMGRTPGWITWLMAARNLAAKPFGLKTELDRTGRPDKTIGWFPVLDQSASEVVLGLDDRHLDFRILIEVKELGTGKQEVTASTAVKTHNLIGRVYLAIVKPFHRIIVPAMLAQVLTD